MEILIIVITQPLHYIWIDTLYMYQQIFDRAKNNRNGVVSETRGTELVKPAIFLYQRYNCHKSQNAGIF